MGKGRFLRIIVVGVIIAALIGCAKIPVRKPVTPPPSPPLADLSDQDIPPEFLEKLKEAGRGAPGIVPYIFIKIASHFDFLAEERRMVDNLQRAEDEFGRRKVSTGQGLAATYRISAYLRMGRRAQAEGEIKRISDLWLTPPLALFVLYNRGLDQLHLGNFAEAAGYFRRAREENRDFRKDINLLILRRDTALGLARATLYPRYLEKLGKRNALPEKVDLFRERPPLAEKLGHLEEAFELSREFSETEVGKLSSAVSRKISEFGLYHLSAVAGIINDDPAEARKNLLQCLELAKDANYPRGQLAALFHLGQVSLGEPLEGIRMATELRDLADRYRLTFYRIWSRYVLARHFKETGRVKEARSILMEAMVFAEERSAQLIIDPVWAGHTFDRRLLYEEAIDLFAAGVDPAVSLDLAERWKASQMVDSLAGRDLGKNQAESAILTQLQDLERKREELERRIVGLLNSKRAEDEAEGLKEAEVKRRELLKEIEKTSLFPDVVVGSFSVTGIQGQLDQDTTLFSYYAGERQLIIWAITKDKIHSVTAAVSLHDLSSLASGFLEAVDRRERRRVDLLSRRLYDIILKPIIPFVSGDRLGFIPHGPLNRVPFALLSSRGRHLNDGFSIFYLPHLGFLSRNLPRKAPREGRITVFGSPDPGSKDAPVTVSAGELEAIRRRAPQASFVGKSGATAQGIKTALSSNNPLVLFLPFVLVGERPLESYLAVSGGSEERISALEIRKQNFQGSLVLLAGRNLTGDPAAMRQFFLPEAFLGAGSPSVLYSWWNIDEPARADFLDGFFKHLRRGKETADALRDAQLEMAKKGHPPAVWASFILLGRY